MASHIWDVKRFKPETIDRAMETINAIKGKADNMDEAAAFVGYYCEVIRQAGVVKREMGKRVWRTPADLWEKSVLHKKYASGKNGVGYLAAGKRFISACAERFGLVKDTPPEIVWDFVCSR